MSLVTVNTAALPFILQAENKNLLLFDIADLNIHGLCKTNGRVMFVVDSRAIVLVSRDDTHTFLFPALPPLCTLLHGSPPERFESRGDFKKKTLTITKAELNEKTGRLQDEPHPGG